LKGAAGMEPTQQPFIAEALDRLWAQFLPQMKERVATLEAASAELATGKFTVGQREQANSAAHKLAGTLGTFGLTKGTVLAREAEIIYSGEPDTDPDAAARLAEIAAQLRVIVESRK
jgi:HPt (histidine-containing phosphotransfer) domain-containing protein